MSESTHDTASSDVEKYVEEVLERGAVVLHEVLEKRCPEEVQKVFAAYEAIEDRADSATKEQARVTVITLLFSRVMELANEKLLEKDIDPTYNKLVQAAGSKDLAEAAISAAKELTNDLKACVPEIAEANFSLSLDRIADEIVKRYEAK